MRRKNPNLSVCADWHSLGPASDSETATESESGNDDSDVTPNLSRRPSGSCLKSPGKTPPGTPTDKKQVRFADDMADHLADGVSMAFDDASLGCYNNNNKTESPLQDEYRYLTTCFPQPGVHPKFLHRVSEQKVCLESLVIAEDMAVLGTVRAANIGYHKHVNVRFTTDNWRRHYDIPANYVQNSCDGATDQFSFGLSLPKNFPVGSRLELAVFYHVNGQEYWDSNHGSNYIVACYAKTTSPTDYQDKWWHHFV